LSNHKQAVIGLSFFVATEPQMLTGK